jgi:hypothetical protein
LGEFKGRKAGMPTWKGIQFLSFGNSENGKKRVSKKIHKKL